MNAPWRPKPAPPAGASDTARRERLRRFVP